MTLRFFTFSFCLFLFASSSARADSTLFASYTQTDGLAADYVTSIAFAPGNIVWIGTPRGATFVQDKYWVTYTSANGLGSSWVSGIATAADPSGKVFFATNGGGLSVFDGGNRKSYSTSNSTIPSNFLTSVAMDRQNRVWIGTLGAGVARLDGEQWTRANTGLTNQYINALTLDARGNPWAATNDGAFYLDGANWARVTTANGLANNRVNAVTVAPDGRVWFGTEDGASVFDGRRFQTYRDSDGLADNSVRAIAVDAKNRAWLGTLRGLSLFDGTTWKKYSRADGLADNLAFTLALDPQSNIWIGTPHGLSIAGTTLQKIPTLPMVLIHGWRGPDSDLLDDSEFRHIRKYLERDGVRVFYAAGISPQKTLLQNSEALREVIANAKAKTGASKVDLLAFSMGGLNARAYLESSLYQNDVRRAIILGTPQAGVRLWYPLLTREIEERPNEPSAIELSPEYAALFNRTHAPRVTVPYDLLTGDARSQTGLDLLKIFPASDGLIDQWSAHALTGPLVRREVGTDVHAWEPAPAYLSPISYLYPDQTYARFIRNALRDPDVRPIGFAAPPVEPTAPRNITPMNVDSLRASETITRAVTIDANRAARFFARWTRGDVDLQLRAPDGTRYAAANLRDAFYLKADLGDFIGYSIPRALAGQWLMIANRLDRDDKPLLLTTYADLDADLQLNASSDKSWYRAGAPVKISATLSNRARGADVRARIRWLGDGVNPRPEPVETKMQDDGDGAYSIKPPDLSRGGYYLVGITARGAGFARESRLLFSVSPNTAALAGNVQARTEDANGKFSALIIESDVQVNSDGAFALAASLRGPQNQAITAITAPLTLKAGTQRVSIAVPGRDILARGVSGPFAIDLILMDASWVAVQMDEALNVLMTEGLSANDFGE